MGLRGLRLDQAQPLLDALDPAIHIVEAQLGRGVVDLHRRHFAKAGLDTVEPIMDAPEIGAQKFENA
jgi:hypothetical protein